MEEMKETIKANRSDDIAALNDAIEKNPKNAFLYYERGWAKLQIKDKEGCLNDWENVLKLEPDYADVYASKALLYFLNGELQLSEKNIARALSINPELKNKLDHLKGLIKQQKETPEKNVLNSAKGGKKEDSPPEVNSRRDFLKKAAIFGAASTAAISFASCATEHVLEGKDTRVRWGKIIDLNRCAGCKACSVACKAENHTPPGIAYHVVMEEEKRKYPYSKREFLPMPCMQCKNSTCIPICPVKATYYRKDGVVVIDYDKCIGCRYCIATCPYGSRSFDYGHYYSHDRSNPWEMQPSPEYGQYRKREDKKSPIGNVRKCTSCLHRIYNGIPPACSATCIGNAIHFGDLNDPEAKCMVHGVNLQELLARRNYFVLKEETGNAPRVYYLT